MKKTTILDLSKAVTKVVAVYENDKLPHINLADYIGGGTVDEIVHKYRLKTEPMPNWLDKQCWCEGKMLAAIQRLK